MSYVVVVPAYKEIPSPEERYSLLQLRRLAIKNVTLICPYNLNVSAYQLLFPEIVIVRFDSIHFHDLHHYNRLVSSVFFYQHFSNDYQWLLINQLDAFLLDDRINYFCKLGYDYYGAPWKGGVDSPLFLFNRRLLKRWGSRFYVGNGGFSLRNIDNTINLLVRKNNHISHHLFSEDLFFGYWGTHDSHFQACPVGIAASFALETNPRYWMTDLTEQPMGLHAPFKWDPEYYSALLQPQYDQIDMAYPKLAISINL
jgi:hypothetical protein